MAQKKPANVEEADAVRELVRQIDAISAGVEAMMEVGLNRDVLIRLIQYAAPARVSVANIELVLRGLEDLREVCLSDE